MRISRRKREQRLRRKSVEQWVDRVGVGRLEPSVRLKPEPRGVFLIEVVVNASRLDLLVIIARMRDALAIRATVSIVRNRRRSAPRNEWAAENRERRSVRIPVEREHLLIERHRLR